MLDLTQLAAQNRQAHISLETAPSGRHAKTIDTEATLTALRQACELLPRKTMQFLRETVGSLGGKWQYTGHLESSLAMSEALFQLENDLEHRSGTHHPKVEQLNRIRNLLLDAVGENE